MTRRRAYALIAAAGIVGITVGIQNGVRRDRALHDYDWGNQYQLGVGASDFIINVVRIVAPYDPGERGFDYYTGGYAPGNGKVGAAPTRIIAQDTHGAVTVRLRAFDPYTRERGGDEAAEIARIVSLATTRVWPRQPTPVVIDVHVMPDDAAFSLAKLVDWDEGEPYDIAVFMRDRAMVSSTAAHELYHALAGRWSLGTKHPANRARPSSARAYEEVTARLFAHCGTLLATGSLSRDARSAALNIQDQRFEGALDGEELAAALELLSREVPGAYLLDDLLARTILADTFGEEETIALESPQGEKLLGRCRESAVNPMLLEFRLAEMLTRRERQSDQTALDD